MDKERQQKTDANTEKKRIIQIQTACPGWFALFEAFEYSVEAGFDVEGCFAVPIAGWALWEDAETGKRKVEPFFGSGELLDQQEQKNFQRVVFRPDWLNSKLNGSESVIESNPLSVSKNRLEVEFRTSNQPSLHE